MAGFRQARGSSNTICKDRRSWRWRCPPRCWSTAWPSDHLAAPQGQQPARPWHRLLLPQPEAPTMPMASPASRFKSMPSTARSQRDRQGHGPDRACRQRRPVTCKRGRVELCLGLAWPSFRTAIRKHRLPRSSRWSQVARMEGAGISARHLQHIVPGAAPGQHARNGPGQAAFATAGRPPPGQDDPPPPRSETRSVMPADVRDREWSACRAGEGPSIAKSTPVLVGVKAGRQEDVVGEGRAALSGRDVHLLGTDG